MNIRKPNVSQKFLRHKEINDYLDVLGRRYSSFVTTVNIGKTFEGRTIKAIMIDLYKNSENKPPRNWILIEAGTHAREWITISVALFCIYQLIEKHGRNQNILEIASFFIIPVVNVDGYEYTHEKNRSWRKNRRPIPDCKFVGTDCNRNYDIHWERGCKTGCKSIYRGETPFSESETCALRNVMQKLSPHLKFVLSLHSYAQSIMYPWGYTKDLPPTWEYLHELAQTGRDAIHKATGRWYRCGSISSVTKHTIPGSIADYAFGVEKVPCVIVMELPSSKYKFFPPPQQIADIAAESWIGVKAMCQKAISISICKESLNKAIQ